MTFAKICKFHLLYRYPLTLSQICVKQRKQTTCNNKLPLEKYPEVRGLISGEEKEERNQLKLKKNNKIMIQGKKKKKKIEPNTMWCKNSFGS